MKAILIAYFLFFIPLSISAQNLQPEILSVKFHQGYQDSIVKITYDVYEPDGDLLNIKVMASDNSGLTYDIPINAVSGDVGTGIEWGVEKEINWNINVDLPAGWYSWNAVVKVIADDGQGYTSYDAEWIEIPTGPYKIGPNTKSPIDYNYAAMKYEVSIQKYADFLNKSYQEGLINIQYTGNQPISFSGYFPGDDDFIEDGEKLFGQLLWNVSYKNPMLQFVDGKFTWYNPFEGRYGNESDPEFPVHVTYFGAWAFANYYNLQIPTKEEWQKLAYGNVGFTYPIGNSIDSSNVNIHWFDYYHTPWMRNFPYLNAVTPVGFYNGQALEGIMGYYSNGTPKINFQTSNAPNQYGLYDVMGNADEWSSTPYYNSTISNPQKTVLGIAYDVSFNQVWAMEVMSSPKYEAGFRCINRAGIEKKSDIGSLYVHTLTDINEDKIITDFSLSQNFPNPFNPTTIIKYTVPSNGYVSLKVYDILGKEVAVLVNEQKSAGNYEVTFDAKNLSSGIYFYQMSSSNFSKTNKMILLK